MDGALGELLEKGVAMVGRHGLGLLLFACLFVVIEKLRPAIPQQRLWRDGSRLDLALSLLNPLVVWPINAYLVVALINHLIGVIGAENYLSLRSGIESQPYWVQFAAALVVADFLSYWKHRMFHMRWLWPIHSVHHSTREVDWLTNDRDHPLQLAGTYFFVLTGLALIGFAPETVAAQAVFRRAYSLYTHANVDWSHGPLQRIFVSPAMHRWHHADDERMVGRNFATVLALYDVLFGTYRVPDAKPQAFGVPGVEPPIGFWAALRYPFELYRSMVAGATADSTTAAVDGFDRV